MIKQFSAIEAIGILASVVVLCSSLFKTTTYSGTLKMRGINMLGCAIFIVYGLILPAYAVAVLNSIMLIVHGIFIAIEYSSHHKQLKNIDEKDM